MCRERERVYQPIDEALSIRNVLIAFDFNSHIEVIVHSKYSKYSLKLQIKINSFNCIFSIDSFMIIVCTSQNHIIHTFKLIVNVAQTTDEYRHPFHHTYSWILRCRPQVMIVGLNYCGFRTSSFVYAEFGDNACASACVRDTLLFSV